MLKRDHPMWVLHQNALHSSWRFVCRQPWATLMTVLVIALSLLLAAVCWITNQHIAQMRISWQSNGPISLYINPDLAPPAQQSLLDKIKAMPGVAQVSYTSPADGLAILTQQAGLADLADYLPHNPLPAVIEVTPDVTLRTPAAVDHLYQTLRSLADVEDASLDGDWMKRAYVGLNIITQLTQYLMLILSCLVILVIGNTVRLIIYHRQVEIEVLQLLGAADSFILRPFLYAALWYAILASSVAWALLNLIWFIVAWALRQWTISYSLVVVLPTIPLPLGFALMFVTVALASLSAHVTVKWYLFKHYRI